MDFTDIEKEIIDTSAFQRLRELHQVPSVRYVYPGAEHNRFEHSIGVMHTASNICEYLQQGNKKAKKVEEGIKLEHMKIDPEDIQMVRLAGLLHDIGRAPLSHLFDRVYELVKGKKAKNHEARASWIIDKNYIFI